MGGSIGGGNWRLLIIFYMNNKISMYKYLGTYIQHTCTVNQKKFDAKISYTWVLHYMKFKCMK